MYNHIRYSGYDPFNHTQNFVLPSFIAGKNIFATHERQKKVIWTAQADYSCQSKRISLGMLLFTLLKLFNALNSSRPKIVCCYVAGRWWHCQGLKNWLTNFWRHQHHGILSLAPPQLSLAALKDTRFGQIWYFFVCLAVHMSLCLSFYLSHTLYHFFTQDFS